MMPLVRNDYWIFRIFDYPRLQKLFLSVACLAGLAYAYERDSTLCLVSISAMVINIIYLSVIIAPYTPVGKKQVLRIENIKSDEGISLMIANVYQDNTNYAGCLAEIKKADPDLLLLLEADKHWEQNVAQVEEHYPNTVKVPLDNTYGMLLYSRLKLTNTHIKYLVEDGIPSIHTEVVLRNGKHIQLYAVHPTPPVPQENPRSTERDKELLLVADMAKDCKLPVIVAGDLNDVAWSHTTSLFLKMSKLLDPRRGRGFFNSFHAHYPFLRFPLDHAFISTDFKLKSIRRMNNFSSDHFPIFISLQHDPAAPAEQKPLKADSDDVKEAAEKKAKL